MPGDQQQQKLQQTAPQEEDANTLKRKAVLFAAGLTSRMGFQQQKRLGHYLEAAIYGGSVVAFWIGHHFQSFPLVLYILLGVSILVSVLFVPNWSSAFKSMSVGYLHLGEETNFLSEDEVEQYYSLLRDDEQRVEPNRKPPTRY